MLDATGMAGEATMAKIGVGRGAAQLAFLTASGGAEMSEPLAAVEIIEDS